MIRTLSVYPKDPSIDSKGRSLLADAREFLNIQTIDEIRCVKRYYLEGVNEADFQKLKDQLLVEAVWQDAVEDGLFWPEHAYRTEVAYKPGMMNPEVRSLKETAHDLGLLSLEAADTCFEYCFFGSNVDADEVEKVVNRLIMNSLIEAIRRDVPQTLKISGQPGSISLISLRTMSDQALMDLSKYTLFLTLDEMKTIQNYFKEIGRDPTDGELETLAQTWSEHCGHKTFKAPLQIDGKKVAPLFRRLKESTQAINHPRVVSCFVDNSGVFKLNDDYGICMKVETHNSPSALDPYGGAMTGVGGCLRDAVGTGQGAKVIACTDVFCLAPPDLDENEVPEGCKHPRYLLKNLVRGVGDYGNPMGVPTVNGSVHFHPDFRAKPTVIVGAYGLIRLDRAQKGKPRPGDLIMSLGGKTGRDGIHGATFSSAEMTEETEKVNASAVQIGDPIEEKRVFDGIYELSRLGLICAITDCGAGGFSSAIGEMGQDTGAHVDLEKAPLKYLSLAPWEIWVSESQERMVIAIRPEDLDSVHKVLQTFEVEGTVLGHFTNDQRLRVEYNGEMLCDLSMDFLHNGLPNPELIGKTTRDVSPEPSFNGGLRRPLHPATRLRRAPSRSLPLASYPEINPSDDYTEMLESILSHPTFASKEPIVRRYDHNVQGTSVQMPYAGKTYNGPNNASVLEPIPGTGYGVVLGHGLHPVLNRIDPYLGAQWAIFEAVSNVVAQGANPDAIALLDNFIWPKPNEKHLADLSHALDACVETSKILKMPFISGKDSLSSTYRKGDQVIDIPPVLCVSAVGVIDDISKTISSCFKEPGNLVFLIGSTAPEMGGSLYYERLGYVGQQVPSCDPAEMLRLFFALHRAIASGLVLACADVSEGGLASVATEMCFGNEVGVDILLPESSLEDHQMLFSESPGRFVVEVSPDRVDAFQVMFKEIPIVRLGQLNAEGHVQFKRNDRLLLQGDVHRFKKVWQEPMQKVFA